MYNGNSLSTSVRQLPPLNEHKPEPVYFDEEKWIKYYYLVDSIPEHKPETSYIEVPIDKMKPSLEDDKGTSPIQELCQTFAVQQQQIRIIETYGIYYKKAKKKSSKLKKVLRVGGFSMLGITGIAAIFALPPLAVIVIPAGNILAGTLAPVVGGALLSFPLEVSLLTVSWEQVKKIPRTLRLNQR